MIPGRLREIRTERGLGLRELAKKMKSSPTYLSRVETGSESHSPSEGWCDRFAAATFADSDDVKIAAGRIPEDVLAFLRSSSDVVRAVRAISRLVNP